MSSELEDDDPPFIVVTSPDEDSMPLTSLLLGEETPTANNNVEASTSWPLEEDEYDDEDMNRGHIRQNITHLIAKD